MPESILIVDDTPTNRKLTQRVLSGAGYNVRAVPDAASALGAMPEFQPRLVLTDLRLTGMDGATLTRRIKEDPRTRHTLVIVVTGCDAEEDRRAAVLAGCDDFLVKPIDTRALPGVIQAHLARQQQDAEYLPEPAGIAPVELPSWAHELCRQFLDEGLASCRQLLADGAPPEDIRRAAHLWAGLGGTFGYREITTLARRIEERAGQPPAPAAEVNRLLERLSAVFSDASSVRAGAAEPPLSPGLLQSLAGRRIVLAGFTAADAMRLTRALERAQVEVLPASVGTDAACDLVIASADGGAPAVPTRPRLLVGSAERLPMLPDAGACDFVTESWTAAEVLTRAGRLLVRRSTPEGAEPPDPDRKWKVVIADDDPTTLSLLRTTVENSGMDCAVANEGDQALQLIRSFTADAAVLDVMMPNMDGIEVLATVRNDPGLKHVRILMLSALQQETDIVRAFGLGADDYVTKPFSPVEVIARLKRLRRAAS